MRITVSGNLAMLSPWDKSLEELLTVRRKVFDPFAKTPEESVEPMFSLDSRSGVGYIPSGMLERVSALLRKRGVAVEVEDLRKWAELPVPDWSSLDLAYLREGQPELLAAVAAHHSGVLVAPTGFGKTTVLCFICQMYPDASVVVATPRVSVVRTIAGRMGTFPKLAGQVGVMCTGRRDGWDNRITITTTKLMDQSRREECDLLVLDECHCAAASGVSAALARFPHARKWGLSASPTGRGDGADLLLEALIGPVRFERTYQSDVSAGSIVQINAMILKNKTPPPGSYSTRVAMKRHCVWRNTSRNALLAKAAHICAGQGQTLVMCETVEHVMELRRMLPGWATVFASCDKDRYQKFLDKGMTDEPWRDSKWMAEAQARFETGALARVISTGLWREGVDFKKLQFLVRADSMAGEIPTVQITGRLSRTSAGKRVGVLVDVLDEADPQLKGASWKRMKAYKDKGWPVAVLDSVDGLRNLVDVDF